MHHYRAAECAAWLLGSETKSTRYSFRYSKRKKVSALIVSDMSDPTHR